MAKIKDKDFQTKHRTEWQDFLWERFLDRFAGAKSIKIRKSISSFFSKHEQRLLSQRLAIFALMREGKGPREISRILWVSRNSVTVARKNFLNNSGAYKSQKSLKRNGEAPKSQTFKVKDSWLDQLFDSGDIWEIIKNPPRPPGFGLRQ